MILASAQTKPHRGDIEKNLSDHYRMIESASEKGADLIIFPEMSITGYEREDAADLAFTQNDIRLEKLKEAAVLNNIIIVAGAPVKINSSLFIGAFILQPDNTVSIYTKQFLHSGELDFFKPSFDYNPQIRLDDEKISFAVCADIDNPLHCENAFKAGSSIYMPGIFFTSNGIQEAHDLLSGYAGKHSMNVLMSNFCGESYGLGAGGRSAFWNKKGELVAEMNDSEPGFLIVEKVNDCWKGLTLYI